eukprot:541075-Hanusia_phi.AAC.1
MTEMEFSWAGGFGLWSEEKRTMGWQQNPVEFDTVGRGRTAVCCCVTRLQVLNASSFSVGIGSPDVIPLFSKGIPHVVSVGPLAVTRSD